MVVLASLVLFVALHLVPGDPARRLLGNQASQQQVAIKRHELGLDQPVLEQYWHWLKGVVTGDLGTSYGGDSVGQLVSNAFPVTLQLAVYALLLALVLSVLLAAIAVRRPGGAVDTTITVVSSLSASIPSFVWGLTFILLFSLTVRWLPSSGYVSPLEDPEAAVKSLVLPVVALSLPGIGTLARILRASMLDALAQPHAQFARSKGLAMQRLYLVHALKASAVPFVAAAGAEFAYILGDAVVVEYLFAIPGMGKLMIDSYGDREYPIILGVALVYTVLVVIGTAISDAVSSRVDPRVREAALA